jgi:hypothetical protein
VEGAYKKIGKTSFHVDTLKKMSLKQFKGTFEKVLGAEADLDKIYEEVTGKSGKPAKASEDKE